MATFTLTTAADTFTGTAGDDTVNGTAATLNSGDRLTGGDGIDTLALSGSGSFHVDQLATFTGFENITLNNFTNGQATLFLGSQSVAVTGSGTGDEGLSVGSGAVTFHGGSGHNFVSSPSASNWNAGNSIDGGSFGRIDLNGGSAANAVYDLTANTLSHINDLFGFGANLTVQVNSSAFAGVANFEGFGPNDRLVTSDPTLDLSHSTLSGFTVTSTNANGTNFIVHDVGTAFQINGGPGTDTITAQGFAFSADQRNAIFATTSVEQLVDASGTYTAPPQGPNVVKLTTAADTVAGTAGDDTVIGTAATLNSGDSLTGGAGIDTLALYGSGTFQVDRLTAFSGFENITLTNFTNAAADLDLGSQSVAVTGHGTGTEFINLGSGAVTLQGGSGTTFVESRSAANWNAGSSIDGGSIGFLDLNVASAANAVYDLTANTLSHIGDLSGSGDNLTVQVNSAIAAGVARFDGFDVNDKLVTSNPTLDLSHSTISGFTVASTNATSTNFIVHDVGTAFQIYGGSGADTITAQGFTFSADQRNAIFAISSIEQIVDASGTYTAPPQGPNVFKLTTAADTIAGTAGDDTVNGTAATLNSGDSLTGGAGFDILALYGSGTFHIDQLATFTGFESITLNDTSGDASLYLGNQPGAVTGSGAGRETVFLGSGAVAFHGGSGDNFVESPSASNWNAGNSIDGGGFLNFLDLNSDFAANAVYDLTANTLSHINLLRGFGANLTVQINSAVAAGVASFDEFGSNEKLVTSDPTLDLSHSTVSGFTVTSTNASGTNFIVHDVGTALQIHGGPGSDTITAPSFTFSADQRHAIFATTSVERIVDASGTHGLPTITSDGGGDAATVSILENTSAVTTVTATDPDPTQTLTYSITGGADQDKFAIDARTGALSFVTAPDFEIPTDAGKDNVYDVTVQVLAGDGGFATQAIAVRVQDILDIPGAQAVNEDSDLVFSGANGNLISISDAAAGTGNETVTLSVGHGAVTLGAIPAGLSFSSGDGTADASMTFSGSFADVNTALAGLTYRADPNYNGPDQLTAATNGHTGAGAPLQDQDTVAINVAAVNDPPVVTNNGQATATQEQQLVVLDPSITVSDVELDAGNSGSGDYGGASVTFARHGGANTDDTFSFDSTGLFTLGSGNQLQAGGHTFATWASSGGSLSITFNHLATTALVNDVLQHVTYLNNSDDPPASVTIDYTFNDGNTGGQGSGATPGIGSNSTNVDITPINDAPVAVNDSGDATEGTAASPGSNATGNVLANDTDVDNAAASLTVSAVRTGAETGTGAAGTVGTGLAGAHGTLTLNQNGSYTYVVNNSDPAVDGLNTGQSLTDTFTYTARDPGGLTDTAQLVVTIHGVTDPPEAPPPAPTVDSFTADNGGPTGHLDGTAVDHSLVTVSDGATVAGTTLADGSGHFSFSTRLSPGTHVFTALDGDLAGNSSAASNGLAVTFHSQVLTPDANLHEVGLGNFDGSGSPDILLQDVNSGSLTVWLMSGSKQIAAGGPPNVPGADYHVVDIADFNGDHKSDVLLQSVNTGQISVWEMNGTSLIDGGGPPNIPGPNYHVVNVGDFNGDHNTDVLFQSTTNGQIAVWEMNGTSLIEGGGPTNVPGANYHVVDVADFNADGKSDVLFQNTDTGQISVWKMNGTQLIEGGGPDNAPGPDWHAVRTGDFNGDGKSDVLFQNVNTGQISVWLMNGTSLIQGGGPTTALGPDWHVVGVNDFNGDGKSDVLFQNHTNGQIAVWLMDGTSLMQGGAIPNVPGSDWHVVGTADFDGNHKADVLLQSSSGTPALWFMDGTSLVSGGLMTANSVTTGPAAAALPDSGTATAIEPPLHHWDMLM